MAWNPLSARPLPADDAFFNTSPGHLPAKSQVSQRHSPQNPSHPHNVQVATSAFSGGYRAAAHGSPQHQPGWISACPPITAGSFPQTYGHQRERGLVKPSHAGGVLRQTPSNRQESSVVTSSIPEGQVNSSESKSVKHLTCWYWANKGCKLPSHECLYSHFDTGILADPPVQVQRGRELYSY